MNKLKSVLCAALLACVLAAPASADIVVSVVPASQNVNLGDIFAVDIVADIPANEAIIGWGLDLTLSAPALLTQIGPPSISSPWSPLASIDGDDLAASQEFPPDGVSGDDIVLATIVFQAAAFGSTDLILSDDNPLDTTEGFVLADLSGFGTVVYNDGLVNVVPEPATLALLGFGALALIRRRR